MKPEDKIKAIEVFYGTVWETNLVKSMLEDADISAYLKNEVTGSSSGGIFNPFLGGNIAIVVSSEDVENAKLVIEAYQQNMIGYSGDKNGEA
jgi:hypothetical protein